MLTHVCPTYFCLARVHEALLLPMRMYWYRTCHLKALRRRQSVTTSARYLTDQPDSLMRYRGKTSQLGIIAVERHTAVNHTVPHQPAVGQALSLISNSNRLQVVRRAGSYVAGGGAPSQAGQSEEGKERGGRKPLRPA